MNTAPSAVLGTGLVTAVGMRAAACCSAFRAKVASPCETRFLDGGGAWINAHQVDLEPPSSGLAKLVRMACMAVEEALQNLERKRWRELPVLLCVAESERPGRLPGLNDQLLVSIQECLGGGFATQASIVPHGRVSVAVALSQARRWLDEPDLPGVLIIGTDSLLSWPTVSHYERADRLLTESNANGFMPGEGAGALWVGNAKGSTPRLLCTGLGFGLERAHIDSGEPLRAEGLTQAIRACLSEAGCEMNHLDLRITDNAGEHYYFKEAALAATRLVRVPKEAFDLWHPAECTGEIGAVSGISVIAAAEHACARGYAPGHHILAHWANDAGQRAAATLEYRAAV